MKRLAAAEAERARRPHIDPSSVEAAIQDKRAKVEAADHRVNECRQRQDQIRVRRVLLGGRGKLSLHGSSTPPWLARPLCPCRTILGPWRIALRVPDPPLVQPTERFSKRSAMPDRTWM